MLVVVQTYPAHFYQTLLCLTSIKQHVQDLDRLPLMVDDISNLCWPTYVDDCRRLYQGLYSEILPLSRIPNLNTLRKWPWLRQQTNKLMLDLTVDVDTWLFIDGDVRLLADPPRDSVPCQIVDYAGVPLSERDPGPGEMSSQVLFYIQHMLGIEFNGFLDDQSQKPMTSSHPPVHVMRADILRPLRQHTENRFQKSLLEIHRALANDTRMAPCEWDLIECYRQEIMGESQAWYQGPAFCETTWSSDRELGVDWFRSQNIDPDDEIWCVLPEQKYF